MAIKSIHTYFNSTYINIYKQMEHIFTNRTEQNMYIIKDYPELYKEDLIAEIICYKKTLYQHESIQYYNKKYV